MKAEDNELRGNEVESPTKSEENDIDPDWAKIAELSRKSWMNDNPWY